MRIANPLIGILAFLSLLAVSEMKADAAGLTAEIAQQLPAACQGKALDSVDTSKIGVVFLHGKGGTPKGHITGLTDHLKRQGFKVATPEMPWSKGRRYDRTFEEAMEEIDHAVAGLHGQGAEQIFIGGQSLGGTGALGFGARREGLAGVIVVAGGGDPYQIYEFKEKIRASVAKARELATAGKGSKRKTFKDLNQGKVSSVRTTALIYLSFFDPEGPALMPRNAADLGAPLLWIYGRDDPLRDTNNPDYAFALAPPNALNAYVTIDAGHLNAPGNGREVIEVWLRCAAM